MKNNFFEEDDLKNVLEQLNAVQSQEEVPMEDTEEMKAARKRYEDYLLKHKEDK